MNIGLLIVFLYFSINLNAQKQFDSNCIPNQTITTYYDLPNFQHGELGFKKLFCLLVKDTTQIQKALLNNTLKIAWNIFAGNRCAQNIESISSDTVLAKEIENIIHKMAFWNCERPALDSIYEHKVIYCNDTTWNVYFAPPVRINKIVLKPDLTYQLIDTTHKIATDLKNCFNGLAHKTFTIVPSRPEYSDYDKLNSLFNNRKIRRILKKVKTLSHDQDLSLALIRINNEKPQFEAKYKTEKAYKVIKKLEKEIINKKRSTNTLSEYSDDYIIFLSEKISFKGNTYKSCN